MGPESYVGKADAQGRLSLELFGGIGERRVHVHSPKSTWPPEKMVGNLFSFWEFLVLGTATPLKLFKHSY